MTGLHFLWHTFTKDSTNRKFLIMVSIICLVSLVGTFLQTPESWPPKSFLYVFFIFTTITSILAVARTEKNNSLGD
jgi:hypothetical protein